MVVVMQKVFAPNESSVTNALNEMSLIVGEYVLKSFRLIEWKSKKGSRNFFLNLTEWCCFKTLYFSKNISNENTIGMHTEPLKKSDINCSSYHNM